MSRSDDPHDPYRVDLFQLPPKPICSDWYSFGERCSKEATAIAYRWDGHQEHVCLAHRDSLIRRLPSAYRAEPWE